MKMCIRKLMDPATGERLLSITLRDGEGKTYGITIQLEKV